jgi:hypothetical protein
MRFLTACFSFIVLAGCGGPSATVGGGAGVTSADAEALQAKFNRAGNILIADQFNNRILELSSKGVPVWTFGDGTAVASATGIVAPNDVERIGRYTLISATGAPAGAEAACPTGCADNRVVLVDQAGNIAWSYGQAGITGADTNQLNSPVCARYLPSGDVLITDQGNQRIIDVTPDGQIAWQYGTTGVAGAAANQLNNPNSAELLRTGNVLIADESNNRVIEVTPAGDIAWSYGTVSDLTTLNAPAYASRLSNGNTLIADSLNNRIVEVTVDGVVAWQYVTSARSGSVSSPAPTRAMRLRNGRTLISDQFNHQVIEVNDEGEVVFTYGALAVAGSGVGQLNAPYDAKSVADFTGMTSPYGD